VDDLIAFLRARLDEDEQAARKAASLCGCHPDAPSWLFGDDATDGRILVADDPHPQVKRRLRRRWNGSYDGLFMAEHIVRHDPAHVLRKVEAGRKLIELCEEGWAEAGVGHLDAVRLAVYEWADHKDYQEKWRP
jgi:hypothetical protein